MKTQFTSRQIAEAASDRLAAGAKLPESRARAAANSTKHGLTAKSREKGPFSVVFLNESPDAANLHRSDAESLRAWPAFATLQRYAVTHARAYSRAERELRDYHIAKAEPSPTATEDPGHTTTPYKYNDETKLTPLDAPPPIDTPLGPPLATQIES